MRSVAGPGPASASPSIGSSNGPWTRRDKFVAAARRITGGRPHLLVVLATIGAFASAHFLSFLIRFELSVPNLQGSVLLPALPIVLLIQCMLFYVNGVFRIVWAYVAIKDVVRILRASVTSGIVLWGLDAGFLPGGLVPGSILVLDTLLTFLLVCALYAVLRTLREGRRSEALRKGAARRVLIVGAGDSGDRLLREIESTPDVRVVGFIDDAAWKVGRRLRGVPILGETKDAPELARRMRAEIVYVAIPSADGASLRKFVGRLREANLAVKTLPPLDRLSPSTGYLSQLSDVSMDDLLRRKPVRLDETAISAFVQDRTILVTGAAGSIGSELCRQILGFKPRQLVALDRAETPMHDLLLELRKGTHGDRAVFELADVTDRARIRGVFERHRPEMVFHAAALKHVPICEGNPREAVRVNVWGTRNVAEAALRTGAAGFVMISTDKAVHPSSVMGCTKRVAELVIQKLQSRTPSTRFSAVRFGNVLGSNGSVLSIFKSQLARGGPLTITHPEMRRYFMTIPEAVHLVLQAAVLGKGGEIFELDMGPPVRIVDLAGDLIRLSGLVPGVDVKMEFTGIRPGEKLFEELYLDSESIVATAHPQVWCLRGGPERADEAALRLCLDHLRSSVEDSDPILTVVRGDLQELLENDRASHPAA
jgi:FlaA1/EpsC-like NDP-sugar epimerase